MITDKTLFHYCSNASFLSIVSTKELWASEFSLSNDPMEGKWIRRIFEELCGDRSVAEFERSRLVAMLDNLVGFVGACGFCMSEQGDLLSQWRAYADNGAGVALGLNGAYFEQLGTLKQSRNDAFNLTLQKVEYDVAEQKAALSPALDKMIELVKQGALRMPTLLETLSAEEEEKRRHAFRNISTLMFTLFGHIHTLKNPAFVEEREWRAMSHILGTDDTVQRPMAKMEFRALEDRVVPFRRFTLEALTVPSIIEVVIGPRNITPVEFVEALLEKSGWRGVRVRRSGASYRA